MTRGKGSKNKPKEPITFDAPVTTLNEDVKFVQKVDEKLPYRVITGNSDNQIIDHVNWWKQRGYIEQGGVSVTNYRADNGSIVMVYCQALVKKE